MTASIPASYKDKGRRFQQEVATQIRTAFDLPDADVINRPMGSPGTDIILSTAAQARFPFAIECKRAEKWKLHLWWQQAQSNASPVMGIEPLLVFRRNREDTYAITTQSSLRFFSLSSMTVSVRGPAIKWPIRTWIQQAAVEVAESEHPEYIPIVLIRNGSQHIILLYFTDLVRGIHPELTEIAAQRWNRRHVP